jgi:hypothetical protein
MRDYKSVKLDVVSLAELKAVVDQAKSSSYLSANVATQIESIISHVYDQMKYVSNERRSQIELGDFLTRYHYLNADSFSQ